MEKTNALIEIPETASQYRMLWDEILDKIGYGLIWLGSMLWVFYVANGGDIIHCFPVLTCPSPNDVDYNKSSVLSECDKYRNVTGYEGNQSVSILKSFPSVSHYVSTNMYCSQKLQGRLYLSALVLVFMGGYLLFIFRQWYLNPGVVSQIKSFHSLLMGCAELPDCKMLSEVIDAWEELNDDKEPLNPILLNQMPIWEVVRAHNYEKRLKMVDIVSKFNEEEIEKIRMFHIKIKRWKDNLVYDIQSGYICAQVLNLGMIVGFSTVLVFLSSRWQSLLFQEHACKTELKYDITYSEIRCTFAGPYFIRFVCSAATTILILASLSSITVVVLMCWMWRHYLKFYHLLSLRDYNSSAKKLALFIDLDESCIKQIVTDLKYPLHKLSCEMANDSKLLTYVVEEAPLPSCLFSETLNDQEWRLKLANIASFQKSDFIDLDYLPGLKNLEISNCCNISCTLEAHWIRTLQFRSCTTQKELIICDHDRVAPLDNQHRNCWKMHNLEYLAICDPRPYKHLVLDFCNLSELLISNAAISTPLDNLPDVKKLTLKFCRLNQGAVIRKTSQRLLSLTVVSCGLIDLPVLNCPNLHSSDLSENCIRFVKQFDDVDGKGERQEEKEKGQRMEKMGQGKGVERGKIAKKVHPNKGQDSSDTFQALPKLQKLVLNGNQITSLDYDFLEGLKLEKGLAILDVSKNPIRKESMLSDIAILYSFTNWMSASHILDLETYGPYLIEEEESMFPFFPENPNAWRQLDTRVDHPILPQVSNVSLLDGDPDGTYIANPNWVQFPPLPKHHIQQKQVVLYCNIRDNKTRRRMMVYMSCIAQLLYRHENFNICDAFDIPFDAATDISELHIYLALRPNYVQSTINKLQRIAKLAGDGGASVVTMCEVEYGDSSTHNAGEILDSIFASAGRFVWNSLEEYPLLKSSSLFRQMALKLKRGNSLHEVIDDLSKNCTYLTL